MVEELYYMGKNRSVSKKLEEKCKKWIAELDSLKWPREHPYLDIETNLFNTNLNIDTFEQICRYYNRSAKHLIDELTEDLNNVISDNPIEEKYQTAEKLQKFFDGFGDYSFYAAKDYSRVI